MPRIMQSNVRYFHLVDLKLNIFKLLVNVTKPSLLPSKDVKLSMGDSMYEGLYGRSRRVRRPSSSNTIVAILIIKPKIVKTKDLFRGRNRVMKTKKQGGMIRIDVRKMKDRGVFKVKEPIHIRKEMIEFCPSTGKTNTSIIPDERQTQKT